MSEDEFKGPWWKHPYFAYVLLTAVIFIFLLIMGILALKSNWLPKR